MDQYEIPTSSFFQILKQMWYNKFKKLKNALNCENHEN